MAAGESKGAVIAAVIGNLVVAIAKFIAAAITGSSAMIAEGIHSLVDTGNGGLLLVGLKKSTVPADERHPFGHGKELYFWSLLVAVSIFGIGGGMSVYEGISHLYHPSALENPTVNYIVLAFAMAVEGWSFSIAIRHFWKAKGEMGVWEFIRKAKDPSLYTVVFEDSAAMLGLVVAFIGVFLGHLFENPYFDGGASIIIGLILMAVAFILVVETKGLLLGEGMEADDIASLRRIVESDEGVERAGDILTMYMGPHSVLVNLEVVFKDTLSAEAIHETIHRVESGIIAAHPEVARVYIEVQSLAGDPAA